MGNIDGFGQYKIGGTGGGGGISTGRMVSTASFQGWREAPLPFGVPMATWGAGGSGAGGLQDLGFWAVGSLDRYK